MTAIAFVDLETTGATAASDRITEIGIVEVDADGSVREWQQLVNPGRRIAPFVERLTGISNAMVASAPPFAEVAEEVRRRLQGRLFIAHNASFDYGFLKSEFRQLGIDFRAPVLCTVKLSRALYPEFKRHSLDALIERHGLHASGRHRALADARLIHQFWQKIHGDRSADEIASALAELNPYSSLPPHIDAEIVDALPDTPGVYLLYGSRDEQDDLPLYVGKAKNIRSRVLALFSGKQRSPRERALVQQTRRIDWIQTAGEIGTRLRETALVKQLRPTQNGTLRDDEEVCTWTFINAGDGWLRPQLSLVRNLGVGTGKACYGLFSNARQAKEFLRNLVETNQLCDVLSGLEHAPAGEACPGHLAGRCKGACVGQETLASHSARLVGALVALKLPSWPFAGPAVIHEGDEIHVIDGWRYLGTVRSEAEIDDLLAAGRPPFDHSTYTILNKHLRLMKPLHQGQP